MKVIGNQKRVCFDCNVCRAYPSCLLKTLKQRSDDLFNSVLDHQWVVERGETLFTQGSEFNGIYILRSGSFKYIHEDNRVSYTQDAPKVLEFFLAGDVMGLDSLHLAKYAGSVVALESSSVCCVSAKKLLAILPSYPDLLHDLVTKMSKMNERMVRKTHESLSAKDRILSLMQRLSENSKAQGQSDKYFNFPISKQDMANYLGITQETVSRQLADLKRKNVLSIKHKQVEFNL